MSKNNFSPTACLIVPTFARGVLQTDHIQDFVRQVKATLPFIANNNQEEAMRKIAAFIYNKDPRSVFILRGYAGTGKTNLVSAITRALPGIRWRSVLLAPTGRAAKVLSAYSQRPAHTIHKKIYRNGTDGDGAPFFSLAENLHRNTLFIVDEASMIGADTGEGLFNSLLENLFEYIYSGDNCKVILVGDTAQLPPVNSVESPALSPVYLKAAFHLNIFGIELKEVARQKLESGILLNATRLREHLQDKQVPQLTCTHDVINLGGDELQDVLQSSLSAYGNEGVVIITRSNKRANLFNQNFRNRILLFEEDLCTGDKIMVVKNNYFWLPENNGEAGFIANGDIAEITRIKKRETLYGFNFCSCSLRFVDYPNSPELEVNLLTDTLFSEQAALTSEEQKKLYNAVLDDVKDEPHKGIRTAYLKKSPYYNALQVKFSYAITCHKSQGGQWPVVFIDQGYLNKENMDEAFTRWLYTAFTRATHKVYLVNFSPDFFA